MTPAAAAPTVASIDAGGGVSAGSSDEVAQLRAQLGALQAQRRDDMQRLRELDKLRIVVCMTTGIPALLLRAWRALGLTGPLPLHAKRAWRLRMAERVHSPSKLHFSLRPARPARTGIAMLPH